MTPADAAFRDWTAHSLTQVEAALSEWVPLSAPAGVGEAMRYAVLDGGKRLRPLLTLAAARAVAGALLAVPVGEFGALLHGAAQLTRRSASLPQAR